MAINIIDPQQAQDLLDNLKLAHLAKKSCSKCYGRGYTGLNRAKGEVVLCKCVKKNYAEVQRIVKEFNAQLAAQHVVKPTLRQRVAAFFGKGKPDDSLGF